MKIDERLNIQEEQPVSSNTISNRYIESQITLTTRTRPAMSQNDNVLTMKQNLLDVNSKSFELQTIKEYRSELRVTERNRNKTQETSHLRINKRFTAKKYPCRRKSNLYEKRVWVTIPIKYKKSRSPDSSSENNYFCETKFSRICDSKSLFLDKDNLFTRKSKSGKKLLSLRIDRNLSSPTHSLLLKIHKRYIDILQEVKKILKKDVMSKRKLKHILKKQQFHNSNLPKKLHSICINECCRTENEQKCKYEKKKKNDSNIQCLQSTLKIQPTVICSRKCNKFRKFKNIKIPYSTHDLFGQGLNQSTFVCELNTQPNIRSRSPSPALPITREEAILNKQLKNSSNKLSLIEKLEELNSSTTYDLEFEKNLNCLVNNPKHPDISNRIVLISKSSKSDLLTNAILCERSKDSVLVNKKITCENNSSSFTHFPLESCKNQVQCFSSNGFIKKKSSTTTLNNKTKIPENDNLATSYFESTLSKTFSSEISRSKTPLLTRLSQDRQQNFRERKRSVSVTKMTCNFSQTISKNSKFLLQRSCSEDSNLSPSR